MGPKDLIENIKTLKPFIDKGMQWTAKSSIRKFLITVLLIFDASNWYIQSLLKVSSDKNISLQNEVNIIFRQNELEAARDWTNLCLSTAKKDFHKNWYCQQPIDLYKLSKHPESDLKLRIINEKAYGAILVDLENSLRMLKVDRLYQANTNQVQDKLKTYLNKNSLFIFIIALTILMLLLNISFNRYRRNKN